MLRALQESAQFTVLSYNIAGLPAIFSSGNPTTNTPVIARRIGNFDIVNVQEDFNFHEVLYGNDTHPYRTVTSGDVPYGSGLNTLSKLPFSNAMSIQRIQWHQCSNTASYDCLTPKGFSMIQVQLADRVSVDIYNLHADAGTTDADFTARRGNINQLVDYILANSTDRAVIVFGDTNARYTRTGDNIRDLASRTGMTDAWVSYVRKGDPPAAGASPLACDLDQTTNNCEVIDKIFFRGSSLVNLQLVQFNTETAAFADANGKQLSDHVAVSSTFRWWLGQAGASAPSGSAGTSTSAAARPSGVVGSLVRASSVLAVLAVHILS